MHLDAGNGDREGSFGGSKRALKENARFEPSFMTKKLMVRRVQDEARVNSFTVP